jgi:peptidyl-prolyl cis-trans isomerase SurA
MMRRLLALGAVALLLSGCANTFSVPNWVPWFGSSSGATASAAAPAPSPSTPVGEKMETAKPGDVRMRPFEANDDALSDRVIAVVNNDAITLAELQESVATKRSDARQQQRDFADDTIMQDSLNQLIEFRLQIQEADREKIVVDDAEVKEEYAERIKRYGMKNEDEFERVIQAQGLTSESIKKRLRESLKVQKLVRRKVALRVSVTDAEITQYFEENRGKLETGLSYHARHILVVPDADSDAGWETARIRADMLRQQVVQGADFAEVAKQHSKDATAKDGGDLGTLKRGELSQDVEGAILALKVDEVSQPFKSPLGYHVFKLEAKDSLDGEGMIRIRQQIRDILFREKYDTRLEVWIKEIRQRAIIEVRL